MFRRLNRFLPLLLLVAAAGCHSSSTSGVWKLELVTNPTPPAAARAVLFRSLLTNGKGAPLDGGAAVLDLALPSRSGPPIRIHLDPRGNGIYEGHGILPAPGTWTATLTMTRQGHTEIRRFSLPVRSAP